jgi:uncharacterized protein (DUF2147 family)
MARKLLKGILAALTLTSLHAVAQQASPVGLWKSIDDQTNRPKALIRITESNGELRGRIEKLFRDPGEDQNPRCIPCKGELKDQPVIGMTIIKGMRQEGAEYTGGQILDPENGKVYKSRMSLEDNGKKLNVRGYIGVPMLGRTQIWLRQE